MTDRAVLALEDGSVFTGRAIGIPGSTCGEVVFNTAMTGYQEILTDPSYARQVVTLTYPHIGNTGTNDVDLESRAVMAAGLVIRDLPLVASNYRSEYPLETFLADNQVVAIADIDTRRLTRILRDKGAQNGCIMAGKDADPDAALAAAREFPGLKGMDLAQEVSVAAAYVWNEGSLEFVANESRETGRVAARWSAPTGNARGRNFHVVAYDFGIKRNILRLLIDQGCRVTVVPAQTSAEDVMRMQPDGVFLSNGPGDPEPCTYAVDAIRAFLEKKLPVFGICLGHQLLGLASGARTVKMKFGHHGANHPVQDLATGRVMISSQNHGFAVDEDTLPGTLRATHRSLFDGSLQGIERTDCPAYSFQGHPEASPGPHDARPLFARFIEMMEAQP